MSAVINTSDGVLVMIMDLCYATRLEMSLFIMAMLAYTALFSNRLPVPKNTNRDFKYKAQKCEVDEDPDPSTLGSQSPLSTTECDEVEQSLRAAYEKGDHRTVLRHWHLLKRSDRVPDVNLAHAVESMQRLKKDANFVLRELKAFMQRWGAELDMDCFNDLLESLAKRMDSELMDRITEELSSIGLDRDGRTYEIFMSMQFMMRHFQDVKQLVEEMKSKKIPLTTRATIVVIKTALKTNDLEEARQCFRDLKSAWAGQGRGGTPSMAPQHIASQLVELACKEHQLRELLPELEDTAITEEAVNAMLNECSWQRDACLTRSVERLAKSQGVVFSDRTYSLLLKGLTEDSEGAKHVFDEILVREAISSDLALAALAFCHQTSDVDRANLLAERVRPMQVNVLTAFIRFYVGREEFEKACDLYEQEVSNARKTGAAEGGAAENARGLCIDVRLERILMSAALRCGRSSLAKGLLEASPSDVAKHITMIRNCAASGDLAGAVNVFEALERNAVELNSVIYNTVIDACVECRNLTAAEEWMRRTKLAGMADVVSFNTLIKAHLASGHFEKARGLIGEMKTDGLQPNRVTFNEMVNALVIKCSQQKRWEDQLQCRKDIWELISEMQAVGIKPNQVTCSILMKCLQASSSEEDLTKTMDLISNMEEPMDEVLLSSVVEACVRIGKPDLVSSKLKQLQGSSKTTVNGSHTFGSLIKAYGFSGDVDGIWRCWKEMRSRHIRPTSVTLGCMVDAVVNNGDPEGAYELIHQIHEDDQCKDSLNSVIYCSVLKGFAREKKIERAWTVYEEMCTRKVELSIVTYNTLIDACARCGRMDYVPGILEGILKNKMKPNVITYSTMIKGQCQKGDIQTAFALLKEMKTEAGLKPDEIVYNSMLDGCAQNNLVDEGLRLLEEMQTANVPPSNFTLSVLVKLMSRGRRLENAFELVAELSTKYNFKPNVHVYTNLAQACIANRALPRAMEIMSKMMQERIQPESRTYSILIRANISQGRSDQAVGLLRGALGLADCLPMLSTPVAACPRLDHDLVNEALLSIPDTNAALALLSDIRKQKPNVRIQAATQRRLMLQGQGPAGGSGLPGTGGQNDAGGQQGGHTNNYNGGRDRGSAAPGQGRDHGNGNNRGQGPGARGRDVRNQNQNQRW